MEADLLAAVLGKALAAVLPDVLHRPLLAVDVGGRDVGLLAFAVGEDARLWLDALGFHVSGRLGDGQQLRHLPGDTLCSLLVQPLLLGSAGLQLLGRLGEHPGFLLGVEGVAFRFPLQVDAVLLFLM
jgi:hypothetical protein